MQRAGNFQMRCSGPVRLGLGNAGNTKEGSRTVSQQICACSISVGGDLQRRCWGPISLDREEEEEQAVPNKLLGKSPGNFVPVE